MTVAASRFGGWSRLWAVVSLLLFTSVFVSILTGNDIYETANFEGANARRMAEDWAVLGAESNSCRSSKPIQITDNSVAASPRGAEDAPGNPFIVDAKTAFSATISCQSWLQIPKAALTALIAPSLLLITGLAIRWVARGFRRPKPQ